MVKKKNEIDHLMAYNTPIKFHQMTLVAIVSDLKLTDRQIDSLIHSDVQIHIDDIAIICFRVQKLAVSSKIFENHLSIF